ncbi:MAG: gamma-glutamyltransferase [Bryobacteraceae bacterium]|nr:gamma-glutamyltransferase [Bryobacteraceae bacterium]
MRVSSAFIGFLVLCANVSALTPYRAKHAIVVAEEPLAADVGASVLKAGGNAVDAAVAVGFALAVTHPSAGNIGGGGFMLVRMSDGRNRFFDFREKAPASATRNMYIDGQGNANKESIDGWRASGVPGTVRGLELAHKKLGRQSWASNLKPAVRLASKGFEVSYGFAGSLNAASKRLNEYPESKRIFSKSGAGWQAGDRLRQPELARTLKRIARYGARDFYEGRTAVLFAKAMELNSGPITLADLKSYNALEREPLAGKYHGYDVITAPPPSSGGIALLQMLGMLEGTGNEKNGSGSAAHIHFVAETMRRAYADRSEYLGDPDFFRVPVRSLLHPKYIESLRKTIDPARASNSDVIRAGEINGFESTETTHFSIVDKDGNAVSMTYTLNGGYGSGVTVPGLGFLLNNEMDDFSAKPGSPNMFGLVQGEANAIQPGKRPLSSMTPTILLKGGKLHMVVGGPGGGRIITSVLQTILNHVDFGLNVRDSVDAPRFHHQWKPDTLTIEKGFSPDTMRLVAERGHRLQTSASVARIFAIIVQPDGWLSGAADGRGYGKSSGY